MSPKGAIIIKEHWDDGGGTKVYFDLGTAAVVLAGLIGALRVTGKKLTENTYLFVGAGQVSWSRTAHSHDHGFAGI